MATYPLPLCYVPPRSALAIEETGTEPVVASDAKLQASIGFADDDDLITSFCKTARAIVEAETNRAIVTQTRTLRMSDFPDGARQVFDLPGGNILSLTSIAYVDAAGDPQTMSAADYALENGTARKTARVSLAADASWPAVEAAGLPVTVTYEAGYDPDASPAVTAPESLLTAIRMVAAYLFGQRESAIEGKGVTENPVYRQIVAQMRVRRFI